MVAAIRQTLTVKRDGVLEVRSQELKAGDRAEVILLLADATPARSMSSMIGAAKGLYKDAADIDAHIRGERD